MATATQRTEVMKPDGYGYLMNTRTHTVDIFGAYGSPPIIFRVMTDRQESMFHDPDRCQEDGRKVAELLIGNLPAGTIDEIRRFLNCEHARASNPDPNGREQNARDRQMALLVSAFRKIKG